MPVLVHSQSSMYYTARRTFLTANLESRAVLSVSVVLSPGVVEQRLAPLCNTSLILLRLNTFRKMYFKSTIKRLTGKNQSL